MSRVTRPSHITAAPPPTHTHQVPETAAAALRGRPRYAWHAQAGLTAARHGLHASRCCRAAAAPRTAREPAYSRRRAEPQRSSAVPARRPAAPGTVSCAGRGPMTRDKSRQHTHTRTHARTHTHARTRTRTHARAHARTHAHTHTGPSQQAAPPPLRTLAWSTRPSAVYRPRPSAVYRGQEIPHRATGAAWRRRARRHQGRGHAKDANLQEHLVLTRLQGHEHARTRARTHARTHSRTLKDTSTLFSSRSSRSRGCHAAASRPPTLTGPNLS
jgi:hypothetical protein